MDQCYLISVIIPAYNGEKYLSRAVNSILSQKYAEKIEIIIVDDGSKDNTLQIANEFAKHNPQVVVIHQENKGEGGARNTGLENAHGKYLGFCDCDDWWEENFIDEELISELQAGGQIFMNFPSKILPTTMIGKRYMK